jgi:hypothetical protein
MTKPAAGAVLACSLFGMYAAALLATGCSRLPPGSQPPVSGSDGVEVTSVAALVQPLRKNGDLATCRNVLAQLNTHLAATPGDAPRPLSPEEQQFLRQALQLNDDELQEVHASSFTLLDAYHLEQSLTLQDAARSMVLPEVEHPQNRALLAFGWVCRQVRLAEVDEGLVPPLMVLRRGWGTDIQRALVFLALLEQLDIPGCMVALPGASPPRYWIPAALTPDGIFLFDTRLGSPIYEQPARKLASLADVRGAPSLYKPLEAVGYDVTVAEARTAEPHLACLLSAVAPRFRWLQEKLGPELPVRLSQDPRALLKRFREAASSPAFAGAQVRFWSQPGDALAPPRVWRAFVSSEEGGADESRFRQRQFQMTLTPLEKVPPAVERVPKNIEPGIRLRNIFEQPFLALTEKPGGPRDLLIHGRLADAVAQLVTFREELERYQTELRDDPGADAALTAWCGEIVDAHADLLRAQRQAAGGKNPAADLALRQVEQRMNVLWEKWPKVQRAVVGATAVPLTAEVAYQLALAKHEQAELAQTRVNRQRGPTPESTAAAREAWQAAADRWRLYVAQPSPPAEAAATLNRARALAALEDRAAARTVLDEAIPRQRGWNQKALQYYRLQFQE